MAPGLTDLTAAVRASYHLLLGHGLAVAGDPRRGARTPRSASSTTSATVEAATDREADVAAAAPRRRAHQPLVARPDPRPRLPAGHASSCTASSCPERAGDLETIAAPLDWLGLNYYFRQTRRRRPGRPRPVRPPGAAARRAGAPAMDWEVARGRRCETLLLRLTEEYGARSALRHRERLRLPRRRTPRRHRRRPRAHPATWTSTWRPAPRAVPQGCPAGRLLRLVAAGQLRVGVRLRQALRPRPRRLRHAAADGQGQRSPLRRHHPGPPSPGTPRGVAEGAYGRVPPRDGERVSRSARSTPSTDACVRSLHWGAPKSGERPPVEALTAPDVGFRSGESGAGGASNRGHCGQPQRCRTSCWTALHTRDPGVASRAKSEAAPTSWATPRSPPAPRADSPAGRGAPATYRRPSAELPTPAVGLGSRAQPAHGTGRRRPANGPRENPLASALRPLLRSRRPCRRTRRWYP